MAGTVQRFITWDDVLDDPTWREEMEEKVRLYLQAGAQEVRVQYPDH